MGRYAENKTDGASEPSARQTLLKGRRRRKWSPLAIDCGLILPARSDGGWHAACW